jgi:hypothetical protein
MLEVMEMIPAPETEPWMLGNIALIDIETGAVPISQRA